MQKKDILKKKIPDSPGVYFFKKGKSILYIGKATSLKDRIKSYFSSDLISTRGPRIVDMVYLSSNISWIKCNSVLEAILLEAESIKRYQPKYNIKEKDDKSYYEIIVTNEKYPRVLLIRQRDLLTSSIPVKSKYGPFPNSSQIKKALTFIQRIFPFFDTNKPFDQLSEKELKRLSLKFQTGLYPSSLDTYKSNISKIEKILSGNIGGVVKTLKKEMNKAVKELEFEKAGEIKKNIFALEHISDVSLISNEEEKDSFRIEAFDVAHTSGRETVGVMIVLENGKVLKSAYRVFNIKTAKAGDDYKSLEELLSRRLKHLEWPMPSIIVIDGGKGQLNVARKVIPFSIQVVSVVKDERHRPREILSDFAIEKYRREIILANQEAHRFAISVHRRKRLNKFI